MEFSGFLNDLKAIVGDQNVVHHPDDLLVFEYDGSVDRRIPEAVVFPANTREVSAIVALAYYAGIPVVGRGTGTGLSGGSITRQTASRLPSPA